MLPMDKGYCAVCFPISACVCLAASALWHSTNLQYCRVFICDVVTESLFVKLSVMEADTTHILLLNHLISLKNTASLQLQHPAALKLASACYWQQLTLHYCDLQGRGESGGQSSEPQQLQRQLRELDLAEPDQAQQEAQEGAQPALQPPVLALLNTGLPPIVLGTFQGDMQRARIILEAAGFLVPFDLSSSLLPPGLNSSPPQQPAAPALPAGPAGPWPNQMAQPAGQEIGYNSAADEQQVPVQRAASVSEGDPQQMPAQGMCSCLLGCKPCIETLASSTWTYKYIYRPVYQQQLP